MAHTPFPLMNQDYNLLPMVYYLYMLMYISAIAFKIVQCMLKLLILKDQVVISPKTKKCQELHPIQFAFFLLKWINIYYLRYEKPLFNSWQMKTHMYVQKRKQNKRAPFKDKNS